MHRKPIAYATSVNLFSGFTINEGGLEMDGTQGTYCVAVDFWMQVYLPSQ